MLSRSEDSDYYFKYISIPKIQIIIFMKISVHPKLHFPDAIYKPKKWKPPEASTYILHLTWQAFAKHADGRRETEGQRRQ